MADLTITTTQVISEFGSTEWGEAGEAITIGQSVYRAADQTWYKAQCDGTAVQSGSGSRVGIATQGASAGQYFIVQRTGSLTLGAGAGPTVGTVYVVAATAGGIAPWADLASTNYVTVLGVGASSNRLILGPGPNASGQVKP